MHPLSRDFMIEKSSMVEHNQSVTILDFFHSLKRR
jgi:hypothetical protein